MALRETDHPSQPTHTHSATPHRPCTAPPPPLPPLPPSDTGAEGDTVGGVAPSETGNASAAETANPASNKPEPHVCGVQLHAPWDTTAA